MTISIPLHRLRGACLLALTIATLGAGPTPNPPPDPAHLSNVQCESCHGMGTSHAAYGTPQARVEESTCRGCHDATSSPVFDFALYQPHILHTPQASLPELPPNPARQKMKSASAGTH